MSRLEVADIFRAHGPTWRHREQGHFSLGQLKVMSAPPAPATDLSSVGNTRLIYAYKFLNMEYMRRRDDLSQRELMVLLAILRTRENAYGMSVAREIEQHSEREVALAGVYAALERLEAKGLVRSERGDPTPERGGKARTYFKVTGAGLKAVRSAHAVFSSLSGGLKELTVVTL